MRSMETNFAYLAVLLIKYALWFHPF